MVERIADVKGFSPLSTTARVRSVKKQDQQSGDQSFKEHLRRRKKGKEPRKQIDEEQRPSEATAPQKGQGDPSGPAGEGRHTPGQDSHAPSKAAGKRIDIVV